jgi:hypothetical protein
MEKNRIPKKVLYMNFETTRQRGRPSNRWQDEVREDGRIVGVDRWQKKVHKREEWKKFLRTARNGHILHMPMEILQNKAKMHDISTLRLKITSNFYFLRQKFNLHRLHRSHNVRISV